VKVDAIIYFGKKELSVV